MLVTNSQLVNGICIQPLSNVKWPCWTVESCFVIITVNTFPSINKFVVIVCQIPAVLNYYHCETCIQHYELFIQRIHLKTKRYIRVASTFYTVHNLKFFTIDLIPAAIHSRHMLAFDFVSTIRVWKHSINHAPNSPISVIIMRSTKLCSDMFY